MARTSNHILHVREDRPDGFVGPLEPDEITTEIECLGNCHGWQECREPHPFPGCEDGCEDWWDWCEAFDYGDEREFHGVMHHWEDGYGWCVEYLGCVLQVNDAFTEDCYSIALDVGVGDWFVTEDWVDEFAVYAELVGPVVDVGELTSATDGNARPVSGKD